MLISERELRWLNFYRASELHGGLILGQLAQRTRDPELLAKLTRHSAEEVVHAAMWTDTIVRVGGRPAPVRRTYQSVLAGMIEVPTSIFQVLALTQVFERRVYRHFIEHERRPGTHSEIRRTLRRMVEEEKDHLDWVKHWLDAEAERRGTIAVRRVLDDYRRADEQTYQHIVRDLDYVPAQRLSGAS